MPKKLPNGISNYEKLIEDGYYYVDKTKYIEKLEEYNNPNIMILRPRRFGKSLFVSMLNSYYDIEKKDKFNELFSDTYIGKNPTALRNSYYVLNFDFSGIDTTSVESTINSFKMKTLLVLREFANKYDIEFSPNVEDEAENILLSLIKTFEIQKPGGKIYVIIDEYDHFANELLGFHSGDFKDLMSKNGKVRKWYETLKEGTKTVIDNIFITGVAPITLDSMTSGFNIIKDLTRDSEYNEIFGFTEEELITVMKDQELTKQEIEELLPLMRENYDGYKFSIDAQTKMYNSNMCLDFLYEYVRYKRVPRNLVDVNIASDYKKLGNMLNLCQGEEREKIIESSMAGEKIVSQIIEKFNPELGYDKTSLISMLFYLGYLTIDGEVLGKPELKVPNKVMRELYSEYFMERLNENLDLKYNEDRYNTMSEEIAYSGKISELVLIAQDYLTRLSNRDFIKFDEKYVKIIFFCIAMNVKSAFYVKSEMEMQRKYPDLILIPKDRQSEYYSVMIEFKYLKKGEESNLKLKQEEAKAQIKEYSQFEEFKDLEKSKCYTIVAVNDKLYVEEIK